MLNRDRWPFVYARSRHDKAYPEKRLQGKISWGIGGHIVLKDGEGFAGITQSVQREIAEEVELINGNISYVKFIGLINDDGDEVGKVHLGLLYVIYSTAWFIQAKDPEIGIGMTVHPTTLKFACDFLGVGEIEGWSRICEPIVSSWMKE